MVRAAVRRRALGGFAIDGAGRWGYMLDIAGGIGYVRISRFSEGIVEELDAVLRDLAAAHVRGLIIDLRFNPGGLLGEAVAMADRFLSEGVIVRTVNRWGAVRTFTAGTEQVLEGVDLAILVNGASASASEIVAGSLQDHGRAVLVGERTFGKGSVQDFIRIQKGAAGLCLTVAHYQLPGGRMIHKDVGDGLEGEWGVVPDVLVPLGDGERAAILQSRMELDRAGAGGEGEGFVESTALCHLLTDRQLRAAVEALRR
jgi:carboxyl-terminal processing protease